MRRTTRTTVSTLLALPLCAGLAVPALAANAPERVDVSATRSVSTGIILGEVEGRHGNVHDYGVVVEDTTEGRHALGYLDSYTCAAEADSPWHESCEQESATRIDGGSWDLHVADDLGTATVSGTLDLVVMGCDETRCWLDPAGTVAVDLSLEATEEAVRTTEVIRDRHRESGSMVVGVLTRVQRYASTSGTVGGAPVVGDFGLLGTSSFRAVEKL